MRLCELFEGLDVELRGDDSVEIFSVATIQSAEVGSISFLANPAYRKFLRSTQASAVILTEEYWEPCRVSAVICQNPYFIYARIAARLYPSQVSEPGIHKSAQIEPSAKIHRSVWIGPNVVIGAHVEIDANTIIEAGVVLSHDIRIGRNCHIYSNVTIREGVKLGDNAILHPGVVLGGDGFGIANHRGEWHKVPQLGGVIIGNDVEIGANSAIDRGAIEDTIIEDGVKIDNLVQIAHNCVVGEHTAIAGCTGVSGSTRIGKRCIIGGAVAIAGHIEIADDVILTGFTMATKSIKKSGVYSSGIPIKENARWRKDVARFNRLDNLHKRVSDLERNIKK